MAELTKEWLQQTIAELEEERDATPGAVNEDAAMSLAAMKLALASLEAEAVGEVIEQQSGMMLDGLVISEKPTYRNIKGIHNMKMMPLGTQFYTAPPAPVSVPDEAIRSAVDEIMATYAGSADECRKLVRKHIEDACRAAMLQGADGNSPVIPEGWVACSERMPEDEQEVIVQNKMGYRYVSYFDEHSGLFFDMRVGNQMNCIEHIFVTHWMPMPAAPQQEVK
ncbi:DUF551 domain-containing protein [Enterobacter roggenkampii]|uniref:DUF551 domain-containing protein n=1 Tax=Enterobacter roggenkampii TaxID=1812935 RepID=UPI002FD84C82